MFWQDAVCLELEQPFVKLDDGCVVASIGHMGVVVGDRSRACNFVEYLLNYHMVLSVNTSCCDLVRRKFIQLFVIVISLIKVVVGCVDFYGLLRQSSC